MFYSSNVSDLFSQSIFKFYDEKVTSITRSESQLAIMGIFNLMITKKLNCTVPLTRAVVLIQLRMTT